MKTDSDGVHDKNEAAGPVKTKSLNQNNRKYNGAGDQQGSKHISRYSAASIFGGLEKKKKIKLDPIQCPAKRKEKTFLLPWFNVFVFVVQIKTVLMYSSACVTSNDSNSKEEFFH